ncbi:hypothetical protein MKW98_010318, partial [Papaver atlanticum]
YTVFGFVHLNTELELQIIQLEEHLKLDAYVFVEMPKKNEGSSFLLLGQNFLPREPLMSA